MSQQQPYTGYYGAPGSNTQAPSNGFQPGKLLDPGNFTGAGNKNSPPPIDYAGAATATGQASQQAANQQTAQNRPTQLTGFGGQTWGTDANGNPVQMTSLNGPLSGALGGLQGQAANNAANGPQNSLQAENQAISANYNQAASRLNPQWNLAGEQQSTNLANQGLDPTSAAYQSSMTQFNNAKNDAYSSAMNNAIGAGNQTMQAQLQAQMAPYQQMQFLQGFQNGLPGFNAASMYSPANYLQAAEAAGGVLQSANAANQQNQADTMMGAGQLAKAVF